MTGRATAMRHDIYRFIHKGLRAYMCDTLMAVGRLDPLEGDDVAHVLAEVRSLLAFCRSHLEHENSFVHPALERAEPGAAAETAKDHVHHLQAIAHLEAMVEQFEEGRGEVRDAAAHRLYLELSGFVAENLKHMLLEEEQNNRVLWRSHSDEELMAIERSIVATLSGEQKATSARWMLPAMSPQERLAFIGAMRQGLPAMAVQQVLDLVRPHLSDAAWRKLAWVIPVNDDNGQPPAPLTARLQRAVAG